MAMRASHSRRSNMGMCYCLAILDMNTMMAQMSSAGMPYPFHFCRETEELTPLIMKCPPLGFLKRISAQGAETQVQSGDAIIFLSDGFDERFNYQNETWGDEALEDTLQDICRHEHTCDGIIDGLIAACDDFSEGRETVDDMTAVVVRIK